MPPLASVKDSDKRLKTMEATLTTMFSCTGQQYFNKKENKCKDVQKCKVCVHVSTCPACVHVRAHGPAVPCACTVRPRANEQLCTLAQVFARHDAPRVQRVCQ